MTRILPLRSGWDPAPGDDPYPEDLPAEWRLAYFASVFWGVLVPGPVWRGVRAVEAASWAAETPPRFRFFLDLTGHDAAGGLAPICRGFGDRLGGLIGGASALDAMSDSGPSLLQRLASDRAPADVTAGRGLAWEVPGPLVHDLRSAGPWLTARAQHLELQRVGRPLPDGLNPPQVLLLGDCRFDDLERWQTLVWLMGLT